uniref:Uncharacterized protein n=1 Tax=Rhizophora mucronata TaxID=61149 RepID=A0A2P2NEM1_RHIMU
MAVLLLHTSQLYVSLFPITCHIFVAAHLPIFIVNITNE